MRSTTITDQGEYYIKVHSKTSIITNILVLLFVLGFIVACVFYYSYVPLYEILVKFDEGPADAQILKIVPIFIFSFPVLAFLIPLFFILRAILIQIQLEITDTHLFFQKKLLFIILIKKRVAIQAIENWTGNGIEQYSQLVFKPKNGVPLKIGNISLAKLEEIVAKFVAIRKHLNSQTAVNKN